MNDMLAISSSEVRREWSSVMDSVIRSKPAFIKRTRDYMFLCSVETVSELVAGVKYSADVYTESDGSVTLSLRDMDIAVNGADTADAKEKLACEIIEYAEVEGTKAFLRKRRMGAL